jgi:hypothetical protein
MAAPVECVNHVVFADHLTLEATTKVVHRGPADG